MHKHIWYNICMTIVEKYLGLGFFLALNLLIIILTETIGGGTWFFETGIIHIIAIGFVVLTGVRVYSHYYTYDPILEKFIHACLIAMAVFAISHLVEFFSFVVLKNYSDAIYINVANFYLGSLLLITIGAESFIRVLKGRSAALQRLLIAGIVILTALSASLLVNDTLLSLEMHSPVPYFYTVITVITLGLCLHKVRQIKRLVDFMPEFINYLLVSVILIGIATLVSIYYEFFVDLLRIAEYQAIYLSHFAFYASLSALYLAFGKTAHLGGMLEELQKEASSNKELA